MCPRSIIYLGARRFDLIFRVRSIALLDSREDRSQNQARWRNAYLLGEYGTSCRGQAVDFLGCNFVVFRKKFLIVVIFLFTDWSGTREFLFEIVLACHRATLLVDEQVSSSLDSVRSYGQAYHASGHLEVSARSP